MKKHLSIGEAAEYLGISEQTLRRWDKDGTLKATYVSAGSHRYYSLTDLEKRAKGLFRMASEWASAAVPFAPVEEFYCPTSEIFKTRLERMAREMEARAALKDIGPLVTAVAGEIGNNSFDHNLGNWPDMMGAFFAYDLGKRKVALADRGRGVLTTIRAIRPALQNDKEALRVAFTEIVSGRTPEHRGNGLKFVKKVVTKYGWHLQFQSGDAVLKFEKDEHEFSITKADVPIHGCLALIEF